MTELVDELNDNYEIIDNKKIYSVANDSNFLINKEQVHEILAQGGIYDEIKNIKLFQKAFVHESYKSGNDFEKEMKFYGNLNGLSFKENPKILPLQPESSEKFEFVGDGHIQSIVGRYLWIRFPDEDQGFYTKKRSKIVKTEGLYKLASALKFDKYLIISKHVEIIRNGRKNPKLLEDAFEAFIASIFEEFTNQENVGVAYQKVNDFIVNLLHKFIDWTDIIYEEDNYKDILMKFFQKRFDGVFPKYDKVREENNVNNIGQTNRKFTIHIRDPSNNIIGRGDAKTIKEAQQNAAKNALEYFGISSH
jgi:ribonuclease III